MKPKAYSRRLTLSPSRPPGVTALRPDRLALDSGPGLDVPFFLCGIAQRESDGLISRRSPVRFRFP